MIDPNDDHPNALELARKGKAGENKAPEQGQYVSSENIINGKVVGHYLYDTEKGYEVGEIYTAHSPELLKPVLASINAQSGKVCISRESATNAAVQIRAVKILLEEKGVDHSYMKLDKAIEEIEASLESNK